MKKYLVFVFLCALFSAKAQNSDDLSKISLSIVMPDNVEGLNDGNLSKLETKITQIVASKGIAASGYNNNFVIYPKFAIYDTNVVETGMQNITVINCELSLFIKQVDNNTLYSSITKSIKGSGKDKQTALTNAVSKINTNEDDYQIFIEKGKQKIIKYYELKCNDLIIQADGMAKRQNFEQAIALLLSIPSEVSCFSKIQSKSIEIYNNFQSYRCQGLLKQAKTDSAQNDFTSALNSLSQIDPSSKCGIEAKALIGRIEGKIDVENRQKWEAAMLVYKDSVQLEKQRINAVRDIAVEYARNQPKPQADNYLILIR
jgi:hypothetical protein